MLSSEQARRFADEWIAAWNAHDLEQILSHYSNHFEMSSPFVAKMMGEPSGTLKGKSKVREYWRIALEKVPDLHFEVLGVYTGATGIVIRYKSILGLIACESFAFNADGKVCRAAAHYDRIP